VTIQFGVITDEDDFDCLRIKGVSLYRFAFFDISDAEQVKEFAVVRFDATSFKKWCSKFASIYFDG